MSDWSYGRQTVFEILSSGAPVRKLVVSEQVDLRSIKNIVDLAQQRGVPLKRIPKHAMDAMVRGNHQGVALQMEQIGPVEFKDFLASIPPRSKNFVCLLDEIQDPQNLGSILRSAACFGCAGVVIPKWRSAGVTDTVLKASSGAAAHIPVVEISNLTVAVERLKERGFFVYGADAGGEDSLDKVELVFPLALILGNEHRGVKPILKNACDRLIRIPQTQAVASLNVGAAAAVFFYEIARRVAAGR